MKKIISSILVIICLLMSLATTEALAYCNHNWELAHIDEEGGAPCKGYDATYRCNYCGSTKIGFLAPTANHNWQVGFSEPVGCFKDGYVSYYCSYCAELDDKIIPAYGSHDHTFIYNNDATCTKDGTKIGTCKRCGESEILSDEGSAKGHSYGDWKVTFEGTCVRQKSFKRNCKNCGEAQVRYEGYGSHADADKDYKCDFCSADLSPNVPSNPEAPDNAVKDCSCKCHKGGITGFFWKIGNFFAKLFKIRSKQICACGVYHF